MARVGLVSVLLLGFGGLALLGSGAAHADLITMSEASCRGAEKGAPCEGDTGPGTCQPDRCCRLDYSGGTPPKTKCRVCLKCHPGEAAAAPEKAEAPAEKTPEKAPAEKTAPEEAPAEKAPAEKAPEPAQAAPEGKGGCDAGVAGGPFGAGALALGLLLAIGLRRTRR